MGDDDETVRLSAKDRLEAEELLAKLRAARSAAPVTVAEPEDPPAEDDPEVTTRIDLRDLPR